MIVTTESFVPKEVESIIALRAHEARMRLDLYELGHVALSPYEKQKATTLASQIGSVVL